MYNSKNEVQRKRFIKASYNHISTEAAQGKGEYLMALADLNGCPAKSHQAFGEILQNQYSQIFSAGEDRVDQNVRAMINANSGLALNCQ